MFHLQRWNDSFKVLSTRRRWNFEILCIVHFATFCVNPSRVIIKTRRSLERNRTGEKYRFKEWSNVERKQFLMNPRVIDEFLLAPGKSVSRWKSKILGVVLAWSTTLYEISNFSRQKKKKKKYPDRNENEIFSKVVVVFITRDSAGLASRRSSIVTAQPHYDAGHSWLIDQPSILTTT